MSPDFSFWILKFLYQALNCEKASVFSFDLDRQELWARVNEDLTIRIPLGSGVAGRCAGLFAFARWAECCRC
jgi:hypothetical protein